MMAIQAAGNDGSTRSQEPPSYVLYDSGSDENVCPSDLTEDTYDEPSTVMLRDASSAPDAQLLGEHHEGPTGPCAGALTGEPRVP